MRAFFAVIYVSSIIMTSACHREPRDPAYEAQKEQEREMKREAKRQRHSQKKQQYASNPPPPLPPANPGTCEASCNHYLGCKGVGGDPEEVNECVSECRAMNLTPQQLAGYEKTDCTNAIYIVEHPPQAQGQSVQRSSECNGCVWDGSSCIWMSQSNWGAGAYSGAYSSCNSACCR